MRYVSAKFVPKLLNCDQNDRCGTIAQRLLKDVKDNTELLKTAITGDLALDHLFLRRLMKGRIFVTIEEIKTASSEQLKTIPASVHQKCFEDWEKRWLKRIITGANYFEGN
ncbi:uncharacterized protein LOC119656867 isoform X2 [Hermetia illucens]|nr:uncharacterized protein LOC119656867 isoform X2 [Hermetia illucens]